MGWLRQETSYERRMRELEEEAERIRKNMQSLMKTSVRETTPRSTGGAGLRTRSSVLPGQAYNTLDEQAMAEAAEVAASDVGEVTTDTGPVSPAMERSFGPGPGSGTSPRPERLANYLASGSFGKGGSLSRERRIQRNKAIFMAIVAVITIFSLYTWLK